MHFDNCQIWIHSCLDFLNFLILGSIHNHYLDTFVSRMFICNHIWPLCYKQIDIRLIKDSKMLDIYL